MPVIREADVSTDAPDVPNPSLGPYTAQLFSDDGGLTQFGAFVETLPPGSKSSFAHWHETEDEFIYILSGQVTVHEGEAEHLLLPGDAACFKAGTAQAHCLENKSETEVRYLVVGTRAASDVVTYPNHNRILTFDRTTGERVYTTLNGVPADAPE